MKQPSEAAVEVTKGDHGEGEDPLQVAAIILPHFPRVGMLASVVRTHEVSKKARVKFLREGTGCNFSVWSHDSHSYSNNSTCRVPLQRNGSKNKHA